MSVSRSDILCLALLVSSIPLTFHCPHELKKKFYGRHVVVLFDATSQTGFLVSSKQYIPVILIGMMMELAKKTMQTARRYVTSPKHGQTVTKLAWLLHPRTPSPYRVYTGEVGFRINKITYGT